MACTRRRPSISTDNSDYLEDDNPEAQSGSRQRSISSGFQIYHEVLMAADAGAGAGAGAGADAVSGSNA